MSEYSALLANLKERREMYIGTASYEALVSFFVGFDMGNHGGVLTGFSEWLILKSNDGANLHWSGLVTYLAFPESEDPRSVLAQSEQAQEVACMKLLDLFETFDREREERGLRKIFLDYQAWLRNQTWYDRQSPAWYEPPAQ